MNTAPLLRRVVTVLLAVSLLFAAVVGVVEIVLAALDRPYWLVPHEEWAAWLSEQTWTRLVVRAVLVGLVLLGLLLLTVALRRGRPSTLPITSGDPGVTFTASRRSVEKVLAASARRTAGVADASARAGRGTVEVTTATRLRDASDLQQRVGTAVQGSLRDIGLTDSLTPNVRVRHKESR